MFFSILVPVYNAERSLERCLASIRAQSFDDYEVILIDDGSRDNSYAICAAYAEEDPRFQLLRQENRGPSAARNEGLKRVRGTYLCFVDSDDYLMPGYLELLYRRLENDGADALFFGCRCVDRAGRITATKIPPTNQQGTALLAALSERDLFGYPWIKCFSREAVGESRFPEDMSLFEDEVFTCAVLEKAERVAVLPEALYCYVTDGENMLTGRTREDYCMLSDRVFAAWERLLQDAPERESILERKANAFVDRCRYYGLERDVDVRSFFASLAETRFFERHTNWATLDRYVQNGNWTGVRGAIFLYRVKNKLAAQIGPLSKKQKYK